MASSTETGPGENAVKSVVLRYLHGDLNYHVRDKGRTAEWHVDLLNSVQHFTFEFVPRFHHAIVFLLPAFSLSWLKAIRPVGDSVSSDSVEQLLVEITPVCPVTVTKRGDQWLKRFQCLNCSLEADGTRFDMVLVGSLRDDGANEIVSEDVCPDFLPYEFRRLATQDVHLHRLLQGPQIEFGVPASTIEAR